MTHPDVSKILEELDGNRSKFEHFCGLLTGEELDRATPSSTWIVRDFIAHLATIDGPVMRMFQNVHLGSGRGFTESNGRGWNVDTWNEGQVLSRRNQAVEATLVEARASRAAIRQVMETFSAEDLVFEFRFGGDVKRPATTVTIGNYLRGWCKHDPIHVVDMLRALPERLTPDVRTWVNDPLIAGYQKAMNV